MLEYCVLRAVERSSKQRWAGMWTARAEVRSRKQPSPPARQTPPASAPLVVHVHQPCPLSTSLATTVVSITPPHAQHPRMGTDAQHYLAVLRASYDYAPQSDDEIAIREDQLLLLVERTDDECVPGLFLPLSCTLHLLRLLSSRPSSLARCSSWAISPYRHLDWLVCPASLRLPRIAAPPDAVRAAGGRCAPRPTRQMPRSSPQASSPPPTSTRHVLSLPPSPHPALLLTPPPLVASHPPHPPIPPHVLVLVLTTPTLACAHTPGDRPTPQRP